jgi:hypothetical protein
VNLLDGVKRKALPALAIRESWLSENMWGGLDYLYAKKACIAVKPYR